MEPLVLYVSKANKYNLINLKHHEKNNCNRIDYYVHHIS